MLGTVSIDAGVYEVRELHDSGLEKIIADLMSNTVHRFEDVIALDGTRAIIKKPVAAHDPLFPLAFKRALEGIGLVASIDHPEAILELETLLADIPDEDFEKSEILERFPGLSYLEQTYLLEKLRELNQSQA